MREVRNRGGKKGQRLISWVEECDGALDILAVEVRVNFCGGDAFVTEHFLYGAKVGPTFHEVGGEGVAEGVRTDFLCDACNFCQVLHHGENGHAGEFVAVVIKEYDVGSLLLYLHLLSAALNIVADSFAGGFADGDDSFLVSFPDDAYVTFLEVETGEPEVDEFAHAEAATIQNLDDGAIAMAFGCAEVHGIDDAFDLRDAKYGRKFLSEFRGVEECGGVGADGAFDDQKTVEGADARNDSGL